MTEQKETAQKTGKKRLSGWTRVLLFGSLAINLLIVGMVAGAVFRNSGEATERQLLRDMGFGFFGAALTQDDRRVIGRAMAKRSDDLRANRKDFRAQMAQFLDALRAIPFDSEAVQAHSTGLQSKIAERQAVGQNALLDRIAAMSDQERAVFAKRLERSMKRGPRRN
ncbi:MAG: periplasmic heavy metal sensor [Marinosulfonomonas sp.]|nr:periplasmic heavy metal sensor [Marinosulfonomonas sp.]